MKTSAIFLILLTIFSFAYTHKAFDSVRNLLNNFKESNVKEQKDADAREAKERAWCTKAIDGAKLDLGRRISDGKKLKDQIDELELNIGAWKKDLAGRRERIEKNLALIKRFKQERCDNNALFVKNLRDHLEAIDLLSLLRQDIVDYFRSKIPADKPASKPAPKSKSFIQLESQGGLSLVSKIIALTKYANLLDGEGQLMLAELSKFGDDVKNHVSHVDKITAERSRSDKEIGSGHVDNKKGALQKLATPGYEGSLEFNIKTRAKILKMIDDLIARLRLSKKKLTENEIRASIDFAHFQRNIFKENKHLEKTIKKLVIQINEGLAKLAKLKNTYKSHEKLIAQAKAKLKSLENLCSKKFDYFKRETVRRQEENIIINRAITIFNNLIKTSAKYRAARRTDSLYAGEKINKADLTTERVAGEEGGIHKGLASQQKERNEIAF